MSFAGLAVSHTSACCPGLSVFLHLAHLRQKLCQSLPREVFLSAEGIEGEREGEREVW